MVDLDTAIDAFAVTTGNVRGRVARVVDACPDCSSNEIFENELSL